MAKLLDETLQPQNAMVMLRSLSSGRVTCIRHPSEKVQAMREDYEQAKATHKQDALVTAKRCKECTLRCDQAMKAAHQDPLKIQPTVVQGMAEVIPTVVDHTFMSCPTGGHGIALTCMNLPNPPLVACQGIIPPVSGLGHDTKVEPHHHRHISMQEAT
ncbi:hypothetical protein HD554DRAFT_2041349 [Boletus coccyginus]|nr:hypothetical protein HD554DRAFT_2043350 [Boletus coccyginus]KAI9461410.1 hypothetical protein HD554DRAFT_2041349 [Boletus coccyginus]